MDFACATFGPPHHTFTLQTFRYHFFLASLTKLFNGFNSPSIAKMVSMGDKEILPSMKWVNIFDLIVKLLLISTFPISHSLAAKNSFY
jgi:hypothetical protein